MRVMGVDGRLIETFVDGVRGPGHNSVISTDPLWPAACTFVSYDLAGFAQRGKWCLCDKR